MKLCLPKTLIICFVAIFWSTCLVAQNAPFEDATKQVGLEGLSGGVAAWGDFDNDDWTDLYVGGQLWRNNEGKSFTLVKDVPLRGAGIWADFDNDGFLDIFSWESGGVIFLNVQGKSFKEVKSGIPELPMQVSMGATTGDFDNDGLVDLYVGGYEIWGQVNAYHDVILRNKGNGQFEEIWRTAETLRQARGITAADYDQDGDIDIYVSNYRLAPNHLWQNDGKGKFNDVAEQTGTDGDGDLGAWGHTIGSSWGDFDNDGLLDLFVGNFSHPPEYQDRPKFLRNLGSTKSFNFEDQSVTADLHWQESYASPALADFDNDGRLDLFFTCVYQGDKSVLYRNLGDWKFTNVTATANVATESTYQAAWADFDNDGDLDFVSGGKFFRNPNRSGHWIKTRLDGGLKNRSAIGAQVRVTTSDGKIFLRQVCGATGQGNQNDLTLHFGLGESDPGPVAIEVSWPDGEKQKLTSVAERLIKIVRGKSTED